VRVQINGELATIEGAPSKADLLAAARKPVELLQAAPTLYVTQDAAEKARLLKTLVSNYTITDGSVSVVSRSPFGVLARGVKTKEWWSVLTDYRTALLAAGLPREPITASLEIG
jgi:hypothetical protein